MTTGAGFYCVADREYFIGAVGLVNSLRLLGHTEPIHLLDCGLSGEQRALLEPEVSLGEGPRDTPPWLLKTILPLAEPSDTMLLLDVDMIATRSPAPLLESAATGRLVAFRNPVDRHCPEWGELLDLGETQRRPYVSSAALALDRATGAEVLGLMAERQERVDFELTHWRGALAGYPFTYADQDVLNAILSTVIAPDRVEVLDSDLAPTPPFTGLRLVDAAGLSCLNAAGERPYLVHHHTTKPWLEPTHHGVYSQLLRRLLVGDDLAIRVPEALVPPRLRRGLRAYAERKGVNARERLRWHVIEPLRRRRERVR